MRKYKIIVAVSVYIPIMLLPFCLSNISYALPEDKSQPIHLSSNSADLNQSTHQGEYIGNVNFRQGTSHITAERAVTIVNKHNKLTQAIAYGSKDSKAHFSTLTHTNKPRLHAKADVIYYFPMKHLIELKGHAEVTQGQDKFKADTIRYDTFTQHVLSNSISNRRSLIIINSDKIK